MIEKFDIAGYCRISVDLELDRDNTSIENQKAIIEDYVKINFPGSTLTFYEDRDKSGYTFEQRDGYQQMRKQLVSGRKDILIVKDFSRFSRRNSRGLVELEDLRDAGVRIISIGDVIDFPNDDDWLKIQFQFLINEMPVTDTSKKVRSVIKRRQSDGRWICAVPYGYVITNTKTMAFEVDPVQAEVVREIFSLYIDGWGYKKIANHLTEKNIPTPRMCEKARKEARGEECKIKAKPVWSIVTIQGILANDFYIGTLRQGKYTRKKINGADIKIDEDDHIVFENNHEAIIDYRTFALAKEAMKKRTTNNYRGVKKYDNVYSGLMECGDCGSPMFPMSRADLPDAYRCGAYHTRGLKACTSHHTRVDMLDETVKEYLTEIRMTSADMIEKLQKAIAGEKDAINSNRNTVNLLQKQLDEAREERKIYIRQKTREVIKHPEKEAHIESLYEEMIAECDDKIQGLENQIELTENKHNTIIRVNRIANLAINIFDEILNKEKLDKNDLELLIERIYVYEDHIHIKLKADIESILTSGMLPEQQEEAVNFNSDIVDISVFKRQKVLKRNNHKDKVYDVSIVSNGDPLEIYTQADGEVIFKKYSPVGELGADTKQYVDVLARTTGLAAVICDRDRVVAAAGIPKKDIVGKRISPMLESYMERRSSFTLGTDKDNIVISEELPRDVAVMSPIIGSGDILGAVVLLCDEKKKTPGVVDVKLTQVAAGFMSKQMEE
ncbi:MAG: recombinase family protein [Clostridia bacterium]|nr:recombinase family protein [Clostridia bacterium]